ncbi:hypothetical protein [Salinibacterium sp. ZJ450]|uniref:hypothetical protein n=1 Tax=Salinibacterium sp. ZJ450 TaxID=2708338 RepID=UPI001420DBA1|nr:hypothetical protein [Salinibacterium sp. ZJ450]
MKALNRLVRDRGVLEVCAGWHVFKSEIRVDPSKAKGTDKKWGWAANVAVRVSSTRREGEVPVAIMALTFSGPNESVSGEALNLMESVADRWHKPGDAASDNR